VLNVVILLSMIFGVFSILGMGLFGGQFSRCNSVEANYTNSTSTLFTDTFDITQQYIDKEECEEGFFVDEFGTNYTLSWQNPYYNFDNITSSLQTLFVVASLEGWYPIAEDAMASAGVDKSPEQGAFKEGIGFFVIFIAMSNFLGLGLFVGVLCDHFRQQSIEGVNLLMSEEQQAWISTQKNILFSSARFAPRPPTGAVRNFCYRLTKHKVFGIVVMALIMGSVVMVSERSERVSFEEDENIRENPAKWLS